MAIQDLGTPTGRTSKIINVANSATANTPVTALSITGKPGRLSQIYVSSGGGTETLTVTIDGTSYQYISSGTGYIVMNNANGISLTNAQQYASYIDMQWNNSVTVTTQNSTASAGFVNIQYES